METEQEDGRARERRNGFDAAHNMVPTWEHNMARVNQTGGITANYGGRLIPCLRTSQELLRWKENRMRTSEEGRKKNNLHPTFIADLGHLEQKQLCDSAESSHFPVISTLPLESAWPSLWIIHHQVHVPWTLQWIKLPSINFFLLFLPSGLEPVCLQAGQWANRPGRWAKKRSGDETCFREGESAFGLVEVRGRIGSCSCLIGRQCDSMVLIEQNQFRRSNYRSCQQYPWFITTCPTALMAQLTFEHSTKWKDLTFQTAQNKTMPENPSGTIKVTAIMSNFLLFSPLLYVRCFFGL